MCVVTMTEVTMTDYAMPIYTVWDLLSPSSGERKLVVRTAHPDDLRYEHYYQRIAYRGPARNREDALHRARAK